MVEGRLYGWGRFGVSGREILSEDLVAASRDLPLSRGLGRAYGDAALPAPGDEVVLTTTRADRILGFDRASGRLHAEAGLSLAAINEIFRPRGFSSPVLPGTQYVTLGGMVAADVHGKNHHRDGTFGRHVERLRMRVAAGARDADGNEVLETTVWCSRTDHPDLFRATIGGMGLTGHILEVVFRMAPIPSSWIWAEVERLPDLDAMIEGLAEAAETLPFTVGWIDGLTRGRRLGRGVLLRGRWAEPGEAPAEAPRPRRVLGVPWTPPSWLLNRLTIGAFNEVYFRAHPRRARAGIRHPDVFFHPLDAVDGWNRLYGRRGFTQYQCVIPSAAGRAAVRELLDQVAAAGAASFLNVIKDCGDEGEGLLSFPTAGITLALDLPIREGTQRLVDRLNAWLVERGGRIYLAKDLYTRADDFRRMEPRLDEFEAVRRRWDPRGTWRSALSVRIFGAAA